MVTKIQKYLINKGFKVSLVGFKCLDIGIKLAKDKPDYLSAIVKTLYPEIAKKINSEPCKVEREIRHSIESAGLNFTNKEFIARAVLEI